MCRNVLMTAIGLILIPVLASVAMAEKVAAVSSEEEITDADRVALRDGPVRSEPSPAMIDSEAKESAEGMGWGVEFEARLDAPVRTVPAGLFVRGDVFPFSRASNAHLRRVGFGLEVEQSFGGIVEQYSMPVDVAPTQVRIGPSYRFVYASRRLILSARGDAYINTARYEGGYDESYLLLRGTLRAIVNLEKFNMISELGTVAVTPGWNKSESSFMHTLILAASLKRENWEPFAAVIVPLKAEVREAVPLILSVGVYYLP